MQGQISPEVGFALQVEAKSDSIVTAGVSVPVHHRSAMVYEKIFHVGVNNQGVQDFSLFELDSDNSKQGMIWAYDDTNASYLYMQRMFFNRYHRYLPSGVVVADMQNGFDPNDPRRSPQVAQMTPSQEYADAFPGLIATPAMQTQVRFPAATTVVNGLVRTYSFGLVAVTY